MNKTDSAKPKPLKIYKFLKKLCGISKKSKSTEVKHTKVKSPRRVALTKKSSEKEFNVEKWRERIRKTCHDFDAMETTFNTSAVRHDATLNSLHNRSLVYRSELRQMKSEIERLRREKEMLQRGLQTRQTRQSRRARRSPDATHARSRSVARQGEKYLRYRSDSGYRSSTPSSSTYQSNDSNVFYVFL